ncbi:MAG: sigma-70 family RNA polymerase sigma factor [Butyricicoccaceae bacterium]
MTERMTALLRRASEGDREAESVLISENSGLIHTIARRYFGRGAEPDDLYQLACVGFIKAVRGFDPARGNEFSTYAVPKIAGEIRRFLRDDGAVKVSRAVKERARACTPGTERAGGPARLFPERQRTCRCLCADT